MVIFVLDNFFMNIEVQIYISQIKTFFNENPKELTNLIGNVEPEKFFDEMELIATKNFDNGEDVQLTQSQMLDILVKINTNNRYTPPLFMKTKFGKIYLN